MPIPRRFRALKSTQARVPEPKQAARARQREPEPSQAPLADRRARVTPDGLGLERAIKFESDRSKTCVHVMPGPNMKGLKD